MVEKRIPVTEAAQRGVEAVDEVVSYELRGNILRFNFDRPRLVYSRRLISSATIFVRELMVAGSEAQVIRQLRKMLNHG
ncbi:MAG: hypothetical protein ABI700_01095 [Chloroflexota bacterium]